MTPDVSSQAEELDCLVPIGENEWVRGFLQLPGQTANGRLRLVEYLPDIDVGASRLEPIKVVLQNQAFGTPACLLDCFALHHGISMSVPPAFPMVLIVNQAIVGSDDANARYGQASIESGGILEFFDHTELKPEDVARAGPVRQDRESADFGDWTLTGVELAGREATDASITLSWSGEIRLEGAEQLLTEWAEPLVKALALFAFCVDRPLAPERIFTSMPDREIDFHARWREPNAPTDTVPFLTHRRLPVPFSELVGRWWNLWHGAEHFLNNVSAYQTRRDDLGVDDRLGILARSLELYHSYAERFDSTVRTPEAHSTLRDQILAELPDEIRHEHGDWIQGALTDANRKRLSLRIVDILTDLGADVQAACGVEDPEAFARTVTVSRNYFTHPKSKTPAAVPSGRDLVALVHRLWFVVRGCVLVELGLPRGGIATALRRSARRHYLIGG